MYGPVPAVAGVGLEVPAGEIRAILGANGAGKSSTIKAILGLVKSRGAIELEGRRIDGLPTHRIHQLGIAWVPEGRQLFSTLTVHENLEMGAVVRIAHEAYLLGVGRLVAEGPSEALMASEDVQRVYLGGA